MDRGRPFCELARMTADDVEENTRGMMWRGYSSKTKKIRKIPVMPKVARLTRKQMEKAPRTPKRGCPRGAIVCHNHRNGAKNPTALPHTAEPPVVPYFASSHFSSFGI